MFNHKVPCNTIVLVNYNRDVERTIIEPISKKLVLETIIPESWLSPQPSNAKRILDWLDTIECYKLTYSKTSEIDRVITNIIS